MSAIAEPMTTETMLALPEDGTERWLIDGELRERPVTVRNLLHSQATSSVASLLKNWRDQQDPPRGIVCSGEAGVRFSRDPDTTVGVDVVYISPELVAQQTGKSTIIEGVPTLVVEILSPNDTVAQIEEKLSSYLRFGVPLVWIVNPYQQTVTIREPGKKPAFVNYDQQLNAEPHLPGFSCAVSELFD